MLDDPGDVVLTERMADKYFPDGNVLGEMMTLNFDGTFSNYLVSGIVKNPPNNSHLVFIGSGILSSTIESEAHVNQNVHYLGFQNQSQMPMFYRLGDVVCLPSRGPRETWGLAINEAMACGCSALVSDRVGCAEDLVAPLNPHAIVGSTDYSTWPKAFYKQCERLTQNRESSRMECRAFIQPFAYPSILAALKTQWHG